ncbi:MAG: ABC transporter ATP-binding protein, partial [Rothia sp. (in: high G+C Gram-positive bacteria)]|nr:ABC transporter ATP-binding protein [Rothia sp. (in: high G+C Gram-positive bacteria)]
DAPDRGPGTLCHDGPPAQVLEEAREELIQAGIWVPGYRPALEPRAGKRTQTQLNPSNQPAVSAQLSVSAQPGSLAGRQTAPLLEAQDLGLSRSVLSARTRRQALAAQQAQDPSYRLQLPLLAEGINLTLEAGEHLAITGPNGSGKSSLGLVLAGLLPPAAGLLTAGPQLRSPHRGPEPGSSQTQQQTQLRPAPLSWLGRRKPQDLGPAPISWPAAELAARIGLVFQNPEQQFLTGSVREELEFGLRNLARSRRQPLDPQALGQASDLLLERSGLAHLAQANPFTLSGGEKRRLSVASALASEPDLLILDEPTFGQDTKTWAQLLNLLSQLLEEGKTIISITHDQAYLQALGGRVYQMQAEGGRR